ncbi:hypothetical protein BDY24DRAFT_443831 [Mrakia frigida]|uniref:uncharacterized protein n=1 Tax=Mrakia frigida TaxID=29902 RepID=UPI003FCC0355
MLRSTLRSTPRALVPSFSPSPLSIGSRHLASTALFQVAWEKETVKNLKQELTKRGLSSVGKKDVLVARITSDEASFPSSRSLSSSPPAPAAAPSPKKVHSDGQSAKAGETNEETITAPGTVEVSSPATSHVPKKDISSSTQAPGLPNNPLNSAAKTLDVKMPESKEIKEESASIPTILGPGTSSTYPPSPPPAPSSSSSDDTPKLLTTASASTHLTPPRSHSHSLADSHSIDVAEGVKDAANRPLNEQESAGAYLALAIVAGGWFFSYLVDKVSPLAKKKVVELEKKVEGEVEKLEAKAGKLVEEGKEKVGGLVEEGKSKLEKGKGKVEDVVEEGKKKVESGKEKAGELVEEGKKKVEEGKEVVKEKTK